MECDPDEIAWLQEELTAIEAAIRAARAAMLGLMTGAIQSYELSTGQTVQRVTKTNISQLKSQIDGLENDRLIARNKLKGGGSSHVVPGW